MYVRRDIEDLLLRSAESFQVITLYGSRQVGKTTTVEHLFGREFDFVTLDDADELALASSSPKAFFESHPWPVIVDEIQKAPQLLPEIKRLVDAQRREWIRSSEPRRLMFVLTGSNQFELQEGISESLAGRTAVVNMSGFTQMEKRGIHGSPLEVDFDALMRKQHERPGLYRGIREIFADIFQGGMPDVCTGTSQRDMYYKAYVDTYIERDVRRLVSASSELQFRRFISLVALRTAQQLVYSDIARDLGINVETCKRWMSILRTSGIVHLLQPYMANASKRIVKSPKLFFMDTGLCAYLCKWPTPEMLADCAMSGAFLETYVVSEVVKGLINAGVQPDQCLYYYRDIDKREVDLLLVRGGCLFPVEVKRGPSPAGPTRNFRALRRFGMPVMRGMVVDGTDRVRSINDEAFALPVSLLGL